MLAHLMDKLKSFINFIKNKIHTNATYVSGIALSAITLFFYKIIEVLVYITKILLLILLNFLSISIFLFESTVNYLIIYPASLIINIVLYFINLFVKILGTIITFIFVTTPFSFLNLIKLLIIHIFNSYKILVGKTDILFDICVVNPLIFMHKLILQLINFIFIGIPSFFSFLLKLIIAYTLKLYILLVNMTDLLVYTCLVNPLAFFIKLVIQFVSFIFYFSFVTIPFFFYYSVKLLMTYSFKAYILLVDKTDILCDVCLINPLAFIIKLVTQLINLIFHFISVKL
jgi:hypothetical protein